jgi:ABC-type antimicrobial peptide transport system permease subunit
VFIHSLDRLVDSPVRTGIPFDAMVADVSDRDLQSIAANQQVATAVAVSSAPLVVDGQTVDGHAMTDHRGSLEIDLADGRRPRTPDEIVLGLRVARDLGKGVGDTVTATDGDGDEHILAVVGTGVVPTFNGELLGLNALVTRVGLARSARSDAFTSAAVIAARGTEPQALIELLAEQFEADAQAVPTEVDNLRQLSHLPSFVAGLVGAIAVVALAHAVVVLVSRRRHDLALLRTVGFTRSQTATAVLVMAVTIAAVGVAIGVPLGIAVGSTVWAVTAEGAFVTTDPLVPWLAIGATSGAALVIVLAAALLPARRAGRTSAAELLRVE